MKSKTYVDAVNEVMNYNDCMVFDLLLGLHCKDVKRKMGFYGRFKLGLMIMRGKWHVGVVTMPDGPTLTTAMTTIAKLVDSERETDK